MHLTEQALRAYLDQECDAAERASAAEHLAACAECRAQRDAMSRRAAEIAAHISALAPAQEDVPAAPRALARLKSRIDNPAQQEEREKSPMLSSVFSKRLRPLWAGLAVLAVLAVALSFAPVRAWAGQFLGIFRAQQMTVLPIDTTRMSALTGNSSLSRQIQQLLADSVTVRREPGEPQPVADAATAGKLAGFTIRLPSSRTDVPQLTVQNGAAFDIVVNRARGQELLNEAGRSDLQLPAALDGATISVDIPAAVTASYGSCPKISEAVDPDEPGSAGRRFPDCVIFAQVPSPTVNTPPSIDLRELAEIGLQFTGMSAQEARNLSQTVDWTSTLVVPIPRNAAVYKSITVDGVNGYLIQRPADDAPEYLVMWVKDGIVYTIGGLGSDSATAIQMANSLK